MPVQGTSNLWVSQAEQKVGQRKDRLIHSALDPQDIDKPQYRDNVWAGVIPLRQLQGEPQPADYNKAPHPPEYWGSRYRDG